MIGNFWHDTGAKELEHHFGCQLARFVRWLCTLLANHAIFPYALLLFGFELKEHSRELVCFCRWHCKAIREHKARYEVSVFPVRCPTNRSLVLTARFGRASLHNPRKFDSSAIFCVESIFEVKTFIARVPTELCNFPHFVPKNLVFR